MRWKIEERPDPIAGQRRVREMFAWWPTVVQGYWVWGETYYREEELEWETGAYDYEGGWRWRIIREWVLD